MASSEEDQMKAALSESRMEIDPVSGNDVPPGALPQEVRDDVDAKLSEGEYVVPADVLRYYGVKFFEDLRNKAKKSLQAMDEDGRIGGAPLEEEMDDLPFSDEELVSQDDTEGEVMKAARGALVGYQEGGMQLSYPSYIKQPNLASVGMPSPSGTASTGGVEYRKYVNDAGMSITIPYYNGQPMGIVPVGYYTESSAPKQGTQDTANIVTEERDGKRDREPDYEGIDYTSLSDDDLQKAFDQTQGKTTKALGLGSILANATPIGAAVGFGNAVSASQIANEIELRTGVRPETKGGLMSKVADFITGADKEVSMSEVVGKDDSGKDTYGAVKGFDSGMGAVAAPPERPDRTTGQDKNDEEKAGGFNSPDRLTGGGR
jgi:Arc/MetJ-type ribon-helix-helix transcriptional regulator